MIFLPVNSFMLPLFPSSSVKTRIKQESSLLSSHRYYLSSFTSGMIDNKAASDHLMNNINRILTAEQQQAEQQAQQQATVRMIYVPTAMYAFRKDSNSSPGKQLQRAKADGRKRRQKVIDHLQESLTLPISVVTYDIKTSTITNPTTVPSTTSSLPSLPSNTSQLLTWNPHIIYIDGGNTFHLHNTLRTSPLKPFLLTYSNIYIGVSAGSIICGSRIRTSLWKGLDDPTIVDEEFPGMYDWENEEGLGLEGEEFFMHYDDKWKEIYEENRSEGTVKIGEDECWCSDVRGII